MTKLFPLDKTVIWQFIRFGIVGAGSGFVYALVTWLGVQFAGLPPPQASVIGYLVSIPMNFLGQRNFAFLSKGSKRLEFVKFCLVHALNAMLAHVVMWTVTKHLQWNYIWGIGLVILIIPFFTYFWLTVFVFTKPKP